MQPQVFAGLCSKFSKNPRGQFNNEGKSRRYSTVYLYLDASRLVAGMVPVSTTKKWTSYELDTFKDHRDFLEKLAKINIKYHDTVNKSKKGECGVCTLFSR